MVPLPFHSFQIDHKGPLKYPWNGKNHNLVIVYSLSRFIQVQSVRSTNAVDKNQAHAKSILSNEIPEKLVYNKGSDFMNQDYQLLARLWHNSRSKKSLLSMDVEVENYHLDENF